MKNLILFGIIILVSFSIKAQKFEVGEKVWAYENDDALWYKATILAVESNNNYKIHWEGFSSEYDESLSVPNLWKEGMPYLTGIKLQGMENDGVWYNLSILKRDLDKKSYFITWDGYDAKYNRWISYDSLRLPTKENKIEENTGNYATTSSSSGGGNISISINLRNSCGSSSYYIYESGGSSTKSNLGGNSVYTMSYLKSGDKIWASDSDGQKSSLLFEVSSSSQNNSEVVICR